MRHDRRCFGRLEQEDQRLKKHYDRWMDIVRSPELELFILTKLTKHSIPVNLVGPQVSLPPRWVPTSRGSIHFFVRNKEAQKNEYPLLAGTHHSGRMTCGPTKLTGTEGFVNLVNMNDSSSSDRTMSIQRP